MKRALLLSRAVAASDFDDEPGYYSDVYNPDMLPGEGEMAYRLRVEFVAAGYEIRTVKEAKTHPVIIVRAVRRSALPITKQKLLCWHFQELLGRAGFCLQKREVTVDVNGMKILVAFPSGKPAADWEEILREPQEDLGDYAEMPL